MARIVGRSRVRHKLEIHPKYVARARIGEFTGRRSGSYLVFDVGAGFAAAYAAALPCLIRRAREHAGHEESVELGLLQRNGATAEVFCFDRQIQVPGTRRTLDIVGVTSDGAPALVAIEVKRYYDSRIQSVPRQLHEYLEILDPGRAGLREDIARSYRTVCSQLRRLGRPAPDPERITAGMPVRGARGGQRLQHGFATPATGAPIGRDARAADLPLATGPRRVRDPAALTMGAYGPGRALTPGAQDSGPVQRRMGVAERAAGTGKARPPGTRARIDGRYQRSRTAERDDLPLTECGRRGVMGAALRARCRLAPCPTKVERPRRIEE